MRKKLFAVIMSVMMMVTFMPTMAFAASCEVVGTEWDFNSQKATVWYQVPGKPQAQSETYSITDLAEDFVDQDAVDSSMAPPFLLGAVNAALPQTIRGNYLNYGSYNQYATYFDLTGASIVNLNNSGKEKIMEFSADEYCDMVDQSNSLTGAKLKAEYGIEDLLGSYIKFVEPSYLAGKAEPSTAYVDYTEDGEFFSFTSGYTKLLGRNSVENILSDDDQSMNLITVKASLPTYEKYQETQNFPVNLTFKKNEINDIMGTPFGVINDTQATSEHQINIYSDVAGMVNLTMDSMKSGQNVTLYSSKAEALEEFMSEVENNVMLGFYNGAEQNLHATTQNVDVQYSTDKGLTWGDAPALKDANLSYIELVSVLTSEGVDAVASNILEKILDNVVYVKVTKGNSTMYAVIEPVVLPREIIVEYKNSQLNFAPGKNLTSNDVLQAKALAGDETLSAILGAIAPGEVPEVLGQALGLLKSTKSEICEADTAMAEKFVEKYFELKDMPTAGTGNKVEFAKNVQINLSALLKDIKADAELAMFMNNYDLLPELLLLDAGKLGEIPFEISGDTDLETFIRAFMLLYTNGTIPEDVLNQLIEDINGYISPEDTRISVNTDLVKVIKSVVDTVKSNVISTATVNYDKEFTQITAKKLTKTFHVKKAKALAKKKTFKYKATTDYGTLEYKKLSGNKKITVRDDGKVTVKKGLKKGTYTVRVKVSVPEAGKHVNKSVVVKIKK